MYNKYMLFAGLGSVRIVKNCDRGLENAARGRSPRAAFQSRGHSFSLYGPTLSRQITYLFISCYKLAYKWVYATVSLNWPGLRTVYEPSSKLNLTSERASNLKKHVLKNRFISNYFMKAASSSPVKLSAPKLFFLCEISCKV